MSDAKQQQALEEHRAKVEAMKAAEKRLRAWLSEPEHDSLRWHDVQLMLERIDAYENSITWHTDCLNCPTLYDQLYTQEMVVEATVTAIVKWLRTPLPGTLCEHQDRDDGLANAIEAGAWKTKP